MSNFKRFNVTQSQTNGGEVAGLSSPERSALEGSTPELSFVVPIMNEEDSLEQLVQGISQNVGVRSFEIILIDDGSTDDSWMVIQALADLHPEVIGIRFRSNRGKAAGLQVGFDQARGDLIFTMDGDLQDDPQEIPRFIKKIEEGYDLVSGWKAVRHDPWHKVLPSRIFNRMLSRISRVRLHDHNCGFKCYRRSVVESIQLFGELHRMVPAMAGMRGFKVTEIVVQHHAREFGVSKYGIERFIRGFSDMLTMGFLRVYRERPSHFTNACAAMLVGVAGVLTVFGTLAGIGTVAALAYGLTAVIVLAIGGACVVAGLLSELLIRNGQLPTARDAVVYSTQRSHVFSVSHQHERAVSTESIAAELELTIV